MEFNIYIYIYKRNLHIYRSLQEDIKCELDQVLSLKILQELKRVLSTIAQIPDVASGCIHIRPTLLFFLDNIL